MCRYLALLLVVLCAGSLADTIYVNHKLVRGYSITYDADGDVHVDTIPADFDCPNFGGTHWNLGENVTYTTGQIGYIPFLADGTGVFKISSDQQAKAGISKCPAGFWIAGPNTNCGMSGLSGAVRWQGGGNSSRCNLQAGKIYYLNVRLPDCDSKNGAEPCKVKITK